MGVAVPHCLGPKGLSSAGLVMPQACGTPGLWHAPSAPSELRVDMQRGAGPEDGAARASRLKPLPPRRHWQVGGASGGNAVWGWRRRRRGFGGSERVQQSAGQVAQGVSGLLRPDGVGPRTEANHAHVDCAVEAALVDQVLRACARRGGTQSKGTADGRLGGSTGALAGRRTPQHRHA